MNEDINNYVPSILNPRCVKKHDISLTQNSIVSRCSLSLKRGKVVPQKNVLKKVELPDKENSPNTINLVPPPEVWCKNVTRSKALLGKNSITFSAIDDLEAQTIEVSSFTSEKLFFDENLIKLKYDKQIILEDNLDSYKTVSSATELVKEDVKSEITLFNEIKNTHRDRTLINISFGINNCESVDVTTRNSAINRFTVTHNNTSTNVDCEVLETSEISTDTIETEFDENMNEISPSQLKRSAVSVNLEIKKQKLSATDRTEYSKVLILNTNAIEKISHVIVQPPNYKFVKRNIPRNKLKNNNKSVEYGKTACLKQIPIDCFFRSHVTVDSKIGSDKWEDAEEMSRNSGVTDAVKCERVVRSAKVFRREGNDLPKSAKLPKREAFSPRRLDVKTSNSEAPSPRLASSKNAESIHFSLPNKSKSNKSPLSPRNIPHHKIVAGTHFAVDAFSYGDIPNVKHYFLTHFHTDHYSGLKKSFNKLLFCSKITADLCMSRLGVNPKCIHVINIDETLRVDGVEVTAVDANHCPGALMLVFTLPNGKTLLHTGDFRACPPMESYPVFWNRDIHTIYLDTTYCNPRYDFPTQDQSLEMALYILRQKKMALEKADKKFSSVLIVCGTYTIGKEKFFLGMSRRVGCSVWACPEKERVLKTVEGKACSRDAPEACQLHVVPMRDLTHEKLRSYLDSLQGAFSEVVAFKPSGWENGKNSCMEKDGVTIHGIPYSEHSSFSELIRFVKFLKPKQVVPTVDISGGVKAVQKHFPCPLVYKDEIQCQSKLTDYFSIQSRQQASAVT